MNGTIALDTPVCFHCGEALASPVSIQVELDGVPRQVCCSGCAAAAQWIRDAGLGDYYRLRQADGQRVDQSRDDYRVWDRTDVQHGHVIDGRHGKEITVVVEGMRCAACAWLIDRALMQCPGVQSVSANAVTGRVQLGWDAQQTQLSSVLSRLAGLGYRPHLARGESAERERRRERSVLIARLGVAALGAMQAMMFAEALYLDSAREMAPATRDFFRWITFLVATPVVFYSGWPFLSGMVRELRQHRAGMDTLIASSVLLAYGASLVETLRGGAQVWFDAAVMFVLFLLAARLLERLARQRASAQLDTLARAQPALAWRERPDDAGNGSRREQVPVSALDVGDIVQVATGDAIPADGCVLDDAIDVDEALLTGESVAVSKPVGAEVLAGSLCRQRSARIEVTRTGSNTRLSQLTRVVERASAQRPRAAQWADVVAGRMVAFLFLFAIAVFVYWLPSGAGHAFEIALAVLVVSCPCALSLAVPTALASANGALSRHGVLVLGHDALERLAGADTVVFDKTGTLTGGRPSLVDSQVFSGTLAQALAIATALEQGSSHPLAAALRQAATASGADNTGIAAEQISVIPGQGLSGKIGGMEYRLGRAGFAADNDDDAAVWLGDGRRALARFVIADPLRADAVAALAELRQCGLSIQVLSGDAPSAVASLCGSLGIADFAARQTPEAKLARVNALQAAGRRVLMVGDGINDAPVLAGADVSVAMADGAPLAQRSADLVLTGQSLRRLPQALRLARRTRAIIGQNLGWAVAYNLLALPFAASGAVTPGIAALGMAASSLLVTGNALRLGRVSHARPDGQAESIVKAGG